MLSGYKVSKPVSSDRAFEMYSWLRVSVSVKQRVYTSRCGSGFRYLGCLGTIVTVLQIFVLL